LISGRIVEEDRMVHASLTLPNGTTVNIDGNPDEVKKLLDFYGAKPKEPEKPPQPGPSRREVGQETAADLTEIVRLVKDCDEAEAIERNVLNRSSQVDRTLLPLYIVHEYLSNAFSLSSGEISKVTTDLGVPVSQPNASTTLSGTAAKYVIGDRVRKRGQPVRYKLSRRGMQYMQSVIRSQANEEPR